ncbi:TetR/AcrR family transcriptional regulator [Patulibacter minatonensis]|uniref:TetR/AcrR family transcriptional regulator n=1 Tax=Patulibacter minatonensis TaxID=298163 RepID=UPI00047AAEF2|nr:TetR/AcrR family transcriptional regulator [Patulibacter minatonensis]
MAPGKSRLTRDAWIAAALDAIAERGLGAVAVEPLAAELGVTKGSFYAHFRTRDALVEAALDAWAAKHGAPGFADFDGIDDPADRLRAVLESAVAFSRSDRPSVHVQLLRETHDPRVRDAVARADEARIAWLSAVYRELGLDAKRSHARAAIAYAAFLGLVQRRGDGGPPSRDLVAELHRTLVDAA